MATTDKDNVRWSQLPVSFTVYAVSFAFFVGGLAMMVNAHEKEIVAIKADVRNNERHISACCDEISTGTKVFKKREK